MRTKLLSAFALGALITASLLGPVSGHAASTTKNASEKQSSSSGKTKKTTAKTASSSSSTKQSSRKPASTASRKATPQTAAKSKTSRTASNKKTKESSPKSAAKSKTKTKKLAAAPRDHDPLEHQTNPQQLAIASSAAIVVEQGHAEPIYQKNSQVVVPIASITKLMTAMVVLDSVPNLRETIHVGEDDVDFLKGSRSRLNVGAQLSREDALLISLMSSENRATHALARHYPGGLSALITAMNRKAVQLGMYNTRFEDPTGLSSNNVSTAQDLAKMVTAAHRYPLIREFSTTSEATIEVSGRSMEYRNTNALVKSNDWDIGLSKTGFIQEAGRCLVMMARVMDKPLVIVLLDAQGKLARIGDANRIKRWMETTQASTRRNTPNA